MNRTIAMRRCALVCALFTLTGIIPIFGQTLTETITHPLIDPLPQEGAFESLVPCGGPVDNEDVQLEGYLMNIQLSGLEEGEYYELVYNADFFETNGVQNIQLDAGVSETSFDIPIGFCNYEVSSDPLQASYQLYLGGVMDGELVANLLITYDPFVINNPNYDLTTTYYDGVEIDVDNDMDLIIPPNGEYPNSSNLYYQNDSHPFSRITDITLDDNDLVPNSLTLFYIPEDEISPLLVRIECVDPGCLGSSIDITDFSTIPVEIPLDGWPVDELAGGHSIRVVEEFVIQDCGTVADVAETAFRLSPCGCGDFVQTHTMNALVNPFGGDIQFCFNLERDGADIEGIPLFNDGDDDFDIRYTFTNPDVADNQLNTGHKELGWIVVPIDLRPLIPGFNDSWTIEQVNTWLSANTYLQLDPYVDIPEGVQPGCQIGGSDPYSPIILAPDGFIQVYQENIGMSDPGECDVQQNLDPFRRIAFDFSKLDNSYALAHPDVFNTEGSLTNWYGVGETNLWNTFMEGDSFSLLIKNLEFDHEMFRSVNGNSTIANDTEIIDEYYFLHSCDPEGDCSYTCGAGGWSIFQMGTVSSSDFYPLHQFYVVCRDMCARFGAAEPMQVHQELIDLDADCPVYSGEVNSAMTVLTTSGNSLQFRNPHVTITPQANPPGIVNVNEFLEIDFIYGMNDQSGGDLDELLQNPFDYQSGPWETLFACENPDNRGRVSIPLALAHRCAITIENIEHLTPEGCDGAATALPLLTYAFNQDFDTDLYIADCAELYVIQSGIRQPLIDDFGNIATCSDDQKFYLDFKLEQISVPDFDLSCNRIRVHAQWTYQATDDPDENPLSCPVICDCEACALDGGTQEDDISLTLYAVCTENVPTCPDPDTGIASNLEVRIHQLACSQQGIFYVCGPECTTDYHCYSENGFEPFTSCEGDGDYLNVHFNTLVWDDQNNENPFKMVRNTFGYDLEPYTLQVDLDGDGIVDVIPEPNDGSFGEEDDFDGDFYLDEHFEYNHETGYPTSAFTEENAWPTGVVDNELSLIHFLPGDQVLMEAKGWYSAGIGSSTDVSQLDGNGLLVYVIQTDLNDSFFTLPCVPGSGLDDYEISITIDNGVDTHTFPASDFIITSCFSMEDPEGLDGPKTTITFVFEDFYDGICEDGTCAPGTIFTGGWSVQFNGFMFMNPDTDDSVSHLNEIFKGSFALLNPNYLNDGYCPEVYSCDNNTAFGNYHELWVDYDLELNESNGVLTTCTRPYLLRFNHISAQGELINLVYGDEFRPIYGINSFTLHSTETSEYLNLDHTYWDNPRVGAGLWYEGAAWNIGMRNFYNRLEAPDGPSIYETHTLYIEPEFMPMPAINNIGHAKRVLHGSAEVMTPSIAGENQQIGESAIINPVSIADFHGQIMQCEALTVEVDLDYYLDDHIEDYLNALSNEGICTDVNLEDIAPIEDVVVNTNLNNSRVGFASGLTVDNDLVSQSGTFESGTIQYFDFTNQSGNTATMSFFVTIEDMEGIDFTDVRLVKQVEYFNGTPTYTEIFDVEYSEPVDGSNATTYFFHDDYYRQVNNGKDPYLNYVYERNRMFSASGSNYALTYHLEWDYVLDDCIDEFGESMEDPSQSIDFEYYYGQACAWYENPGDLVPQFSRCQTCISYDPNCPDCGAPGVPSVDCADDQQVVDTAGEIISLGQLSNSLVGVLEGILDGDAYPEQRYHTGYDGFVGYMTAVWGNEFLEANISISDGCDQTLCVELANGDSTDQNVMDAEITSITIEYPNSWPALSTTDLFISNGMVDGTSISYTSDGTTTTAWLTFTSTMDSISPVLQALDSLTVCFQFVDWDMSLFEQGLCTITVNAETICGNVMSVDNGTTSFQMGGVMELTGTLTLDETNPCIPQLCGSITGQSGNMESVTISYPAVWVDPVLVSSSCDVCLDAANYSVPGEVTLNFNQDYIVSDPTSFDFCFDFDLIEPLVWEILWGEPSTDLGMSFEYTSPCGDTLAGVAEDVIWTTPNPSLTSTMEITYEACSPTACITYLNEGDQAVNLEQIQLFPYYYDTPVVSSPDCVGCTFEIGGTLNAVVIWAADQVTYDQLVIAPGETMELCIEIPISNPDDFIGVSNPFGVTTSYSWACGLNYLTPAEANGTIDLYQNFDFTLNFNEQDASCPDGFNTVGGSVDITPYDPLSFDYAWTGYPGGFTADPFINNPTDMPAGSYTLGLTDLETGCVMSYDVVIDSTSCCDTTATYLLGGMLTLDETNPCIPQLCGSITGQSGNMESVTISYPAVWLDPVLVSSSCDVCLDAADYSVPGEVTLNFNQDYIVSDPTSFDFCFDFDLIDPLIWANGLGMTSADLVLSFDYLTPCGDTLTSQPNSALWEVPNPALTSSLEISYEDCSPVACITYTSDGDETVSITSIQLSPYYYDTPIVTGDCIGCTFTPLPVGVNMALIPADAATEAQLQLAPGESIELCVTMVISDPETYQNVVMPLTVTTPFSWSCGSIQNVDYPVSSGTFELYQNFDFTIDFNETNATCLNGSPQNDGSVDILPYDPIGFDYAWTTYPGGFDPLPFVSNPTNMPPGDYVLTLTDNETDCEMDYPVTIGSNICCGIVSDGFNYQDCIATYSFDIIADCSDPEVTVQIINPDGGIDLPTYENYFDGNYEFSFETNLEGDYQVTVYVFCGPSAPCVTHSFFLSTDPGCLSVPEPNCFAIWDNESINTYFMEGNAVISSVNTTKYSVLGSAHEPDALLNYYNARLDGEDAYIYARDFGDDATANSKTEYIIDAVEYNGFIYNVGYGAYPGGSGERNCFMISKIDMETGIPVVRRRYHLSNSSNDVATGIDIYQTPSGETRLFVAGYTDVNQAQRGIDAFATSFSLNLAIANLYTYDFMNKNNYAYEVKNVGQNSHFVVVGKVETLASAFMLDYNFNVTDEFTFKSKVSELTSVELDGNQLFFVGNYSPNANETKAMIFKSGLSWGNGTTFRTLENSGDSENFDWARDLVIYNSRVYIAGQSGENLERGLLVEVNPSTLIPVWSKHTDPELSLKAVSDILHLDNSIGIIAVGDTKAGTEDAIAVVHSDLDGNSCCLSTTTMKVDQGVDNFLFGYTRIQRPTANVKLNLGLTPFVPLPICDPEFKNAEDVLMVSSPNADLYVVPNPNDGQFELMLSAQEAWLTQVVILDVTGQEIFTSTYPAQDQIRSLSIGADLGLKSGMYLVHVRLSNGEELSTRAVVGR